MSRLRLQASFFVCLYGISFLVIFSRICTVFSSVEGYQCGDVSLGYYGLSFFVIFLSSFSISVVKNSPSTLFLWLIFYLHFAPSVLVFHVFSGVGFASVLVWSVVTAVAFSLVSLLLRRDSYHLVSFRINRSWVLASVLAVALLFAMILVRDFGFSIRPPSISDVYGTRAEYKESVSTLGGYVAILIGYFISPCLVVLSIDCWSSRKLLSFALLTFAGCMSLLVYSVSGFKSVAFAFVVVLVFCFVIKRVGLVSRSIHYLVVGGMLLSMAMLFVFDFGVAAEHWVRRVVLVPGMNVGYFYNYEVEHGIAEVSAAPLKVSQFFYGTSGSANSGLIGDGIARFGVGFYWLNVLFLFVLLRISDLVAGKSPYYYSCSLLSLGAYALSNSSLTTVMATYGLVPMLVFLYVWGEARSHV